MSIEAPADAGAVALAQARGETPSVMGPLIPVASQPACAALSARGNHDKKLHGHQSSGSVTAA